MSITFIPNASSLLGSEPGFTDILQSAICKVGLALEDLSPTDEATSEEDVRVQMKTKTSRQLYVLYQMATLP